MWITFLLIVALILGAWIGIGLTRLKPYEWEAVQEARNENAKLRLQAERRRLGFDQTPQVEKFIVPLVLQDEDKRRLDNNEWPIYCIDCISSYPMTLCPHHLSYIAASE